MTADSDQVPAGRNKVLLLGWDSADWRVIHPLLDAGRMPHLKRLIERGVMGNLRTLEPALSPMLWNSIATGKTGDKHGVLSFIEPQPDGRGVRPVSSASRRCKALWNILGGRGLRSHVVNWFASYPAEPIDGICVSNLFCCPAGADFDTWPVPPGSVQPEHFAETFAELRIHPREIDAACILNILPEAQQVVPERDPRITTIAERLAQMYTVHAVGTWLAERDDWDLLAVYFESLDHFSHDFMEYRPPQMPHVGDRDFAVFGEVIDNVYAHHDELLGRYIELAGEEATVVLLSDHGFHSDHMRPAGSSSMDDNPVAWHREYGVFAAAGPGLRSDEHVYGMTLLDVAPTVLTLLGQPVAADMDGSVMTPIWRDPPQVSYVDSYEGEGDATVGETPASPPGATAAALEQLVALGYIDRVPEDAEKAVRQAETSQLTTLITVYQSTNRHHQALDALAQLEQLAGTMAEDENRQALLDAVWSQQATSFAQVGEFSKSQQKIGQRFGGDEAGPERLRLEAQLKIAQGDHRGAIGRLQKVIDAQPGEVGALLQLALCHLNTRSWARCSEVCGRALELNGELDGAWYYLGVAEHFQGRYESAVEKLMRSVSLRFVNPKAHYYLGLSAMQTGNPAMAVRALSLASQQGDGLPEAEEALEEIHRQTDGEFREHEWRGDLGERAPAAAGERPADSSEVRGWMQVARKAVARGDHAEAEASSTRVLDEFPAHLDALYIRSLCRIRGGDWQAAREDLERFVANGEPTAGVRYHLGLTHLAEDSHEEAIGQLEGALEIEPGHPLARFYLGLCKLRTSGVEAAVEQFKKALELDPSLTRAERLLRRLQHDPRAAAALETAVEVGDVRWNVSELPQRTVTLVSGLPRSGTSLMMQMLRAGGMDIMTDGLREADENNPKGYLEFEPAQRLQTDKSWVAGAVDKVVKVIHLQLRHLPAGYRYRVVFMHRDIGDVVASQGKMLQRLGADAPSAPEALAAEFTRQRAEVLRWLHERPEFDTIEVSYDRLVEAPEKALARIDAFFDEDLDLEAMRSAIDPSLRRSKLAGEAP